MFMYAPKKLESLSPKDALCQVWLILVREKKILIFVNIFSLFYNDLPLKKDVILRLDKIEFPPPKDALCKVWLKLAQWFWGRKRQWQKFTNGQTDNGQQAIRKAHLSFQLR